MRVGSAEAPTIATAVGASSARKPASRASRASFKAFPLLVGFQLEPLRLAEACLFSCGRRSARRIVFSLFFQRPLVKPAASALPRSARRGPRAMSRAHGLVGAGPTEMLKFAGDAHV